MKLAVLGTDADVLRLIAASRKLGHAIVWLGDVRPEDSAIIVEAGLGRLDRAAEWELLLDRQVADAVLVGRGVTPGELRAEQLKRLATEAAPLLVVHPVFDSVLHYYEIDMARRESGGIVQHYNPPVGHDIVNVLAEWIAGEHGEIGPIHQITCERRIADATRDRTLARLARDVELLASVAGDIRRVTAIGPKTADRSFASLQVQMMAASRASLRWSVRTAARGEIGFVLALLGERGSVTLEVSEDPASGEHAAWQLETVADGETVREVLQPHDPARAAIERLAEAVADAGVGGVELRATWDAATWAMEVVDAVELSLEKGRTIDVFQQQLTERLAFRGTMAALGCGLLVVGFFVFVFVTLLGGAEGDGVGKLAPFWALALLAVLGFFLLLQAVPMLARQSRKNRSEQRGSSPPE